MRGDYFAWVPYSEGEDNERSNYIVKGIITADKVLRSLCLEMEERLKEERRHPYIVTIINEFADLTMSPDKVLSNNIYRSIISILQKGKQAGIHLVLTTQRPSADVITGLLKWNITTRMAFRTSSRRDSSVILDQAGAEKLIGDGDMLFQSGDNIVRIQGGYISNAEIVRLITAINDQADRAPVSPYYLPEGQVESVPNKYDDRLEEAAYSCFASDCIGKSFTKENGHREWKGKKNNGTTGRARYCLPIREEASNSKCSGENN